MKHNIRLTKEFDFEMAHALEGYDGACQQIHGHSYRLFITILGSPITDNNSPKLGMVMDFGDLKKIVNTLITQRFDHALLLKQTESNAPLLKEMSVKWNRIEATPYQPTCENLLLFIVDQLNAHLPDHIKLVEVKLYETARSYATWSLADNI